MRGAHRWNGLSRTSDASSSWGPAEAYRHLFEANPHPMWIRDLECLDFLDVNEAAVRRYGYSRDEFLSMTIADIRPREDVPALLEVALASSDEVGEKGVWRHRGRDGELIHAEITTHRITLGGRPASLVLAYDVTERVRGEQALRESEERFRAAFEQAAVGMAEEAPDGTMRRVNGALCMILGYDPEELIGRNFRDFTHPDDLEENLEELRRLTTGEEKSSSIEKRYVRKDGSTVWASVSGSVVRDAKGEPKALVVAVKDISERRRAEEELRELNEKLELSVRRRTAQLEAANEELEAFSYAVAHELRGPLTTVLGQAELLLDEGAGGPHGALGGRIEAVARAAERMDRLVADLLRLSSAEPCSLCRERVKISAIAMDVAEELRCSRPGGGPEFCVQAGLVAEGDARLLKILLENLFANASKFTRDREPARIEFGAEPRGGVTTYYVRDNGVGLDPACSGNLFKAFQRGPSGRGFAGMGIGLATVRRIVSRHGGRVWAEGAEGQGATFWFTLSSPNGEPHESLEDAAHRPSWPYCNP